MKFILAQIAHILTKADVVFESVGTSFQIHEKVLI